MCSSGWSGTRFRPPTTSSTASTSAPSRGIIHGAKPGFLSVCRSRHRRNERMPPLRHAILGVGGVGGLIGSSLARLGDSVTLVVRRDSLASYPEQLKLESPFGN